MTHESDISLLSIGASSSRSCLSRVSNASEGPKTHSDAEPTKLSPLLSALLDSFADAVVVACSVSQSENTLRLVYANQLARALLIPAAPPNEMPEISLLDLLEDDIVASPKTTKKISVLKLIQEVTSETRVSINLHMAIRSNNTSQLLQHVHAVITALPLDAIVHNSNGAIPLVFTLKALQSTTTVTSSSLSSDSISETAVTSPNLPFFPSMATSNAHPAPPSRYRAEFDELSCLGKGGFGIVYRARNKLDGIEYAVKKVKLSCTPTQFSLFASSTTSTNRDAVPLTLSTSFVSASTMTAGSVVSQTDARLLNEIKLFARLSQHPNVVSYHTAWIESEPDPTTPTISHIPKVLSKKCSDHSASKSRLTSSLSVLTKNTSPAASVARSTTSQLSESLKSADSEAAVRPAHPRPPATLNTADLVFARNASLLSVCSSSGHSSTNSARMPQHGTEDEFEDLIEFVAAGGGSSADESNGEDEEDSGTSDSDGDDLKCFVWTRGAGAASSAVAIAASPARKATTGKHMSASLPGRFIGSAKSHARPLVPASVSSGLATGESDVETFRASSSRLMSARTLGSSSSLRTTMKDCEESDEEVVSASEDDVVGDLSGFIAEDSAMEEEDERAAERIHKATLYIQMQLCPFMDLRTFLNKRKTASVTTPVPHVNYSVVQAVNTESESHFFHVEDVGSPNPRPSMDSYDSSDDPDYDEDNPNRNTNLLIFKQIVEGLLHIHEQQVVHRDIKPDNIFIQENMHVLVGDFGLAKSLTGHALTLYHPRPLDDSVLESDQAASTDEGTYFYMAPELIDRQVYTAKSDIYSLGIILLELFHTFSTEMERIVTLTELKKNPLHLSHLCDSSTIPHDISLLLARLLSPDPVKRPSALDILHDQCFDSLVPVMIHSPMSGSPSYSAAMNFRRPSMNFTIRASSSYSDFHHHQQIRQRRSASVIQSSVRFSSSPTDMPHFRSMPRSYHASAAFRRSVGAKMGSSSSSLEDRTREYPESTGSGELTPPAMASHPDRSSSLVEAPLEQSGSLAKQAAVPPVNAFSQLWGMIKNVTRPKDMSTASSQALDGTQDEQAAPNRHSAVPAASQYPKNIKHSSSNRSLASTNSTATSLSAKTLERHYADVSAVTPTFKPLPPGLDRRKSFHVIPIASATKRATSAAPISQPPANGSAGSTVFGMSPAESLHSYPRGVHRRASADGALRRSELGVSGVAGVGEDEEHQRILELENDVSVLLEQLVSMKERQMVMEAELAARGMQVVSEDEGEGEV